MGKPLVVLGIIIAIFLGYLIFKDDLPSGIGLRAVPMSVKSRSSLMGEGQVAIIKNISSETLRDVVLVCENAHLCQRKEYHEASWEANKEIELGWLEGWKFLPGETLTISAAGYREQTWHW